MILLDTHVLLWAVSDSPRLGSAARELILSAQSRYVSAITHAELAIKSMRGKLRVPEDFAKRVTDAGFDPLPLHDRHVDGLRDFDALARHEPFDRLLLAQARVDRLTFLTADRVLLGFDGTVDATR